MLGIGKLMAKGQFRHGQSFFEFNKKYPADYVTLLVLTEKQAFPLNASIMSAETL